MMKVDGQQVKRRRRENRGAVGAEDRGAIGAKGCRVWGGGVPLLNGEGFGEGAVPFPQNFF